MIAREDLLNHLLYRAIFEQGHLHFKLISARTFSIQSTNIFLCLPWFRHPAVFELKRIFQVKGYSGS